MFTKFKSFLKNYKFIKLLLGIKKTIDILKTINKRKFIGTSEFKVQNKIYKIKTNPFDLRSYVIPNGRQNHKIIFLKKFLKKGYFFDVGANYGEFAIVLNSRHLKTFCFEPNTFVFNRLADTFKSYKNVFIYNLGVSDKSEKKKLPARILNSGNSSFNTSKKLDFFYSITDYANNVIIPIDANLIQLSKFLKKININKNIFINIKIDVEGFEYKVLNDLINYSYKKKFKLFIMFENNNNSAPYKNQIYKILLKYKKLGFKFIVLPSSIEDFKNFNKNYTYLKNIKLHESSEICITNYEIF